MAVAASSATSRVASRAASRAASNWHAHMTMDFVAGPRRTFVKRRHSGPLSLQRAFYPEGDVCHVYVLHPPGGVVGGDSLQLDAHAGANAAAFVTTPGATKFYRSAGKVAVFNQHLKVTEGCLEWFPQENIFFDGANVQCRTEIDITGEGRFSGWEIQVFGRRAGGHQFQTGYIDSGLSVVINGKPLVLDRLRVTGQDSLRSATGMRGHTVYGTQLFYPFNAIALDQARDLVTTDQGFFMSAFDDCLVVRFLGDDSELARQGFSTLWKHLRKQVSLREGIVPRIWST